MKLSLILFLFTLLTLGDKSFSLSNYKIKKICEKDKNKISCIKNMQEKKFNLQKGNMIEILVIPYKGN
jgi:hypothetical protein